jgi:transcriptional regulator with XRE-family HTH domain
MTTGIRGFDPAAMARLRREHGLTLDELGELLGKSRQHLISWEKGRSSPSPANLVALAAALAVAPAELTAIPGDQVELVDLRARAGFTQAELAAAVGIPRPTYAAIEQGLLALRPPLAAALATALRLEVAELERAFHRRAGAKAL